MRVLWFSLSPCGSAKMKHKIHLIQGWMVSLENEVKKNKDIHLAVCYQEWSEYHNNPFDYEGVKYYPLTMLSNNMSEKWTTLFGGMEKKDAAVLKKIQAVIDDYQPDIIHVHGTEATFVMVNELPNNIPVVYTIQGYKGPTSLKYWSGLPESFVEKYDSLMSKMFRKSSKWTYKRFLYSAEREQRQLRKSKYIIGRTDWDRNISKLIAPQAKYYHLDEIMREPFYSSSWTKEDFSNILTLVTTISTGEFKGLETLLNTALILKENAPFRFEWLIIGCSQNDLYVRQCEEYVGVKAMDVDVQPIGKKDAKELVEILTQADIYVQVSHIENSPNALCEAMLVGIPSIATLAGGTNSILKDKITGTICQEGDAYGIAASVALLKENFSYAKELASEGRKMACKRHDARRIGETLYHIYKDMLADNE